MMNPYIIREPTCISFSMGRSSGYMLYRILMENDGIPQDSVVCLANTGKEEEASLKFAKKCEEMWGVKIVWLEYTTEQPGFRVVSYETACRDGVPFKELVDMRGYLPNPVSRFCTIELKIRIISKYCKSIGMDIGENDSWVGFRADEPRRVAKAGRHRCPLAVDGITARDVGKFWEANDFDLELPNRNGKTMHGNCDLCFLKGGAQVVSLINEKPSRAIWWAEREKEAQEGGKANGDGDRFRKDRPSYAAMMKFTLDQASLFSDETIECFCGD